MHDELIYYSSVASNLFIPIIDVTLIKYTATPWINKELKDLIRRKNNLRYKNCATKWKKIKKLQKKPKKRADEMQEAIMVIYKVDDTHPLYNLNGKQGRTTIERLFELNKEITREEV